MDLDTFWNSKTTELNAERGEEWRGEGEEGRKTDRQNETISEKERKKESNLIVSRESCGLQIIMKRPQSVL